MPSAPRPRRSPANRRVPAPRGRGSALREAPRRERPVARRVAKLAAGAAAFLALAPRAPGQVDAPGDWTALPLPALAERPAPAASLPRMLDGRALLPPRSRALLRSAVDARPSATLDSGALVGLLLDEIEAAGLGVALYPSAPPLLARGGSSELDTLRGVLGELDRLGRALEVRLSVWIEPAPGDFAAVSQRDPDHEVRLRSGQSVSLGRRAAAGFLTGYGIEVALDSGVAAPEPAHAWIGDVLHLRACRVRAGRAVHLDGLLEVTALAGEPARFDPGTPDLGLLEQPGLRVLQLAFSDVVPAAGATAVSVRGSEEGFCDRTVWIRADTTPDPTDGAAGDLAALDLALFEARSVTLPRPEPGAGLVVPGPEAGGEIRVLRPAFPAAQVASAAADGARGARRLAWTPGLVLGPRGEALDRARELVAALESVALETRRLSLAHGTLRVDLPLAAGEPLRILAGTETVRLVDYDTHVAAESWMPVPVVEPVFDGLCIEGLLADAGLSGLAWEATTTAERELEREDVGVGRLQLAQRALEATALCIEGPLAPGDGEGPLTLHSTSPGLTLELRPR